jgi:hypothetical protein
VEQENGMMLTLWTREEIRPVRANRHFPHPLPCHICFHLALAQLKLHGCEKKQGCHLPARCCLRKYGRRKKRKHTIQIKVGILLASDTNYKRQLCLASNVTVHNARKGTCH